MNKAVIYTRVSTNDQCVSNQLKVLREIAEKKGLEVVREYAEEYFDYGVDWCPDSLETGEGICEVVDTNNDGLLSDEEPCNCLGNWVLGSVTELNADWEENNNVDPNGDNWNDCGWDGYCPGNPNDTNGDENGTEKNGVWDTFERFPDQDYKSD